MSEVFIPMTWAQIAAAQKDQAQTPDDDLAPPLQPWYWFMPAPPAIASAAEQKAKPKKCQGIVEEWMNLPR